MIEIDVTTGLGYIKDVNGDIVSKCEFPKGKHKMKDSYTYVEVASKEELDKVQVVMQSTPKTPEQIVEEKIQQEMRQMAIERLQARGEL